jgi:hypothetical protein
MAGVGRHAPLPGTGVAFDPAFLRGSSNISLDSFAATVLTHLLAARQPEALPHPEHNPYITNSSSLSLSACAAQLIALSPPPYTHAGPLMDGAVSPTPCAP